MTQLLPVGLLEIMQCPACRGALHEDATPPSLVCDVCHLRYRVEDGIPVMLVEEAEPAGPDTAKT